MCEISIIVPIYNVEQYLRKCVDSILAQTFTDFEVILVDDGSPDNSGAICDEYAKLDSRVRVIHKENGGLSDARNAGIEIAKGKYLGFVDSDDFIDKDMYEILYNAFSVADIDMSIVGYYDQYGDYILNTDKDIEDFKVIDNIQAVEEILKGRKLTANVWNKLYKKELFQHIRFPKDVIAEDAFVIIELLLLVNKVGVDTKLKYHYMHRKESITSAKFNPKDIDTVSAWQYNYNLIKTNIPSLISDAYARVMWANFFVIDKLAIVKRTQREDKYYKEIKLTLIKNFLKIIKSKNFTFNRKISFLTLLFSNRLYSYLVKKNNSNKWR